MQELYLLCGTALNGLTLVERHVGASQQSDPTHNERNRKFVVVVHVTAQINKIARRLPLLRPARNLWGR
ncbi:MULTISPECIES: hypothetical protein [Paraburkholderia]|uniref:Secreted protein n=1 Tax=Paraburkholderia podalyriae TaxID=1938811 RepID=A0ABR7PYC6_9BURK|nr:hypothetical protein [Paraburkholderia podalyriae]MBC8751285.1 hypothetical protein [Paraburkholderia podalyriae]